MTALYTKGVLGYFKQALASTRPQDRGTLSTRASFY
nr:MAG TPA: hypothetical protein [Caudoviricetes sp.]